MPHRFMLLLALSTSITGLLPAQQEIQSMVLDTPGVRLNFSSLANRSYQIEVLSSYASSSWTPLANQEELVATNTLTDSPMLPVANQQFYRIVEHPFDPGIALFVNPVDG